MKTLRNMLLSAVFLITSATTTAQPMSYYAIRDNARFLTDRMAYTLGIAASLLDDLYCINYDYICGVNDYLDDVALGYRYDDYMAVMAARDAALRSLLTYEQWQRLVALDYFYRPIVFRSNRWFFSIYRHDPHVGHFYFAAPPRYHAYRGGHFFGGMDPRGGHAPGHEAGYAHRGYRFDRPGGNQPGANRQTGDRGGNARGGNNGGSPSSNRGAASGSRGDANSRSDNGRESGNASASNASHSSASSSRNASRDGGRTSARGSRGQSSGNSRSSSASRSSSSAGRSHAVSRPASGNSRSSAARSSSSAQRGGGRR